MLVLSAAAGLMPLYDRAIIASCRIDKLRFVLPPKVGDTIRVEIEIIRCRQKGIGGVVVFKRVIKNQRDELACQADVKIFMKLREAQG